MTAPIVLDAAGGTVGGAGRWKQELDGFLATAGAPPVVVIGRQRRLTGGWLIRREARARHAGLAVAANNVSFALAGEHRRVLVHNALHFVDPGEAPLLRRMPRSFHAQIPVVRRLLDRADTVVVPSSAMAERVHRWVPAVRERIAVRMQPLTPAGPRRPAGRPFILVPLVPGPYKNLVPQLDMLLAAIDRAGRRMQVRVTARPADLPGLAGHPALRCLGYLPAATLADHWCSAVAAFYPSTLEAFGYPLAEARAYGLPVLAPDTALAREVAGAALVPYDPGDALSLAAALERAGAEVTPDPLPFDRVAYFHWLLGEPASGSAARSGVARVRDH
jgi:glycosyltransferase involved in cell wall biosynthesis